MPLSNVVAQQNSQVRKALQAAGLPLLWTTYLLKIGRRLTNPLSGKTKAPELFWADPKGKVNQVYVAKTGKMAPKWVPVSQGDVLERLTFDLTDASVGVRPRLDAPTRVNQIGNIISALAASCEWDDPNMISLTEHSFYDYFVEQAVTRRVVAPNIYKEEAVIALLPMTEKLRRAL